MNDDDEQVTANIPSGNTGLSLIDMWSFTEAIVREREAFTTLCGLVGKNVLDYPGGFRFSPPRRVTEPFFQRHHMDAPEYSIWSQAAYHGTYTVAWYGETCGWVIPDLDSVAPIEVRHHQWFVRALTAFPLPEMRPGVDI